MSLEIVTLRVCQGLLREKKISVMVGESADIRTVTTLCIVVGVFDDVSKSVQTHFWNDENREFVTD